MKAIRYRGLVLNPYPLVKIYWYPDDYFFGIHGYEKATDPEFVKNRTGCVITVSSFQMLWKSKFQTEIALSYMEADIISMANIWKLLFPIMYIIGLL